MDLYDSVVFPYFRRYLVFLGLGLWSQRSGALDTHVI